MGQHPSRLPGQLTPAHDAHAVSIQAGNQLIAGGDTQRPSQLGWQHESTAIT